MINAVNHLLKSICVLINTCSLSYSVTLPRISFFLIVRKELCVCRKLSQGQNHQIKVMELDIFINGIKIEGFDICIVGGIMLLKIINYEIQRLEVVAYTVSQNFYK